MRRRAMWGRTILLISFALVALGSTTKCPRRRASPGREILCYTSTFDVQLLADSVCSCTTLVHQNHDVRNLSISGKFNVAETRNLTDLRKSLREMHPALQFVISIHDGAKTLRTSAALRQEAIARIIAVVKEADGVELNVTAGSKERLYNFVKSLRNEIIRKSYDKRIFVALPSESEDLAKQFDLKELTKYVDLFTLPTDYLTDEDGVYVTFHPSRLMGLFDMLNTDNLIDLISGLGAPRRKILVTVPANAYKFTLKNETDNAPRSRTTEEEPVPIDRKQLCEAMNSGEWTVERDEDLTAPYAFQNKTWISFEDKISVGIKGKYVLLRDLAGLAVRSIENDMKTKCEKPLTEEIYHSFTEFKRKSRQAVLNALEDELHQAQFSYPNQAKTSSFRVARVVDTEGHIRAVRENTQTEFVCRRQGYFVHPKSCNRFYRCVKFNQAIEDYSVFEFDCPAGLSFDERTEVCVWPGSLPQGSPCPGSSEIAPVTPKRFECPSEPGYYADPQNCRWFFACMDLGEPNLMAFEFRCPYGLVFDEKKLVCEWPWLVPACSESGSAYTRTEYNYGGTSAGIGVGGYVTGALPEYSVATGTGYSGVDYSRTTGIHNTNRVNYFEPTGHIGEHTGISTSGTISKHVGLSSSSGGYSESTGRYGDSVSSVPTYSQSPNINVGSISPDTITVRGGSTSPTGHTVSAGHTGIGYSGYSGGVNTGYANTQSLGGLPTGASGYSGAVGGNHLTKEGVTFSEISGSSYSGSTVAGHTGSVTGSNSIAGVSYSQPSGINYFGSTGLPGSSIGSTGPKYVGSTNQYTSSNAFNTDGYSVPTDTYIETTGRQPSSSKTGLLYGVVPELPYSGDTSGIKIDSTNKEYTGSTAEIYRGTTAAGYSKTTSGTGAGSIGIDVKLPTRSGIESSLQSSTYSGRVPETNFVSGVSRPELATSGVSTVPGHAGITVTDNRHFIGGSTRFSGATDASSTGIKYNNEDGYTIPVFVQNEPIYPLSGTTGAGVGGYAGTSETHGVRVTNTYGKPDLAGPNLNVSIFNNQIPTGYGVQTGSTGTILTGSSIEGSILTGDSLSGTILSHGNIPGAVSTAAVDQGTILAGRTQPGYIATSSGTPGYVIDDRVKTVHAGSVSPGTLIYGTPTPAVSLTGPSTAGVILKGDVTPGIAVSGQTAPGVSVGGFIHPGTIVGSIDKPSYISQPGITYHGGGNDVVRDSVTYSSSTLNEGLTSASPQGYKTDGGRGTVIFNTAYDSGKYSGNDIPDYRPTSATLPDSIVSRGRIDSTGGVILGSTLSGVQDSTTASPEYFSPKSSVFTPSGFTKTGPTRTGITTAILGGGGSYSVSTSERRPILKPENIGEKAFEGNVARYTKTSSVSNIAGLSSTLTPPGYSSTFTSGGRITPQPATFGYSYPKPSVKFESISTTSSSIPISSIEGNVPVTTPMPYLNVHVRTGSPDISSGITFGSKIPIVPTDHTLPTPTGTPIIYTEYPETYKTTLFEAARIPVIASTAKPIIDTDYKRPVIVPILTDDRFTQGIGGSQTASVSTSNFGLGVPFQRTDSRTSQKDYSSFTSPSPVLEYLPGKPSKPGVNIPTTEYDISGITVRPELAGVTYKKPLSTSVYGGPSSTISPTTFSPSNVYYSGQGFSSSSSLGTTVRGGSPTNLDISRDKIDKLITNYDRGTVKYTPSVHDTFASSGFDSTAKKFSSSSSATKSSSFVRTGSTFAITTPFSPTTSSYEVTTKSPDGKGKVIVKWSDLHPLLLGKLGAECTCKADPFATLRGPGKKNLIASSKGNVDLANYDESDIYVDLENDGSSEEDDYTTNYDDFPQQPFKISPHQTTTISTNLPSSSYLPVPSTTASTRNFASEFRAGRRTGKKLKEISPSPNSITSDQEEDDPDQIIDGVTDCARPGLFRHPSLCNKFYACHWDKWKKKFTLHIFNCPIHLTFDTKEGACNWPSKGPACQAGNLLV